MDNVLNFTCDGINVFNPIENKLEFFIDAFVSVYGEKYREEIKNKLINSQYIFVLDKDSAKMSRLVSDRLNKIINERVNEFLTGKGLLQAKDVLHGMFTLNDNFYELCSTKKDVYDGFRAILMYTNLLKSYNKKSVLSFFEDKNNYEKFYKILTLLTEKVNNIKKDLYHEVRPIIEAFSENAKRVERVKKECDKNIFNSSKNEIKKLAKENNQELNEQILDEMTTRYIDILKIGSIRFFDNYKLLSSKKRTEIRELLAYLGYSNVSISDNIGFAKLFDFESRFNNLLEEAENACLEVDLFYKNVVNELNCLEASDSDREVFIEYFSNYYKHGYGRGEYVQAYVTNSKEVKNFCVCENAFELALSGLVHEMGHVIEGHKVVNNELQDGLRTTFFYEDGNQVELNMLNEIVNEYFAIKVCKELNKSGQKFLFRGFCKSVYDPAVYVFEDFISKNEDALIDFRMQNRSYSEVVHYFGKDNLEKLENLANMIVKEHGNCEQVEQHKSILKAKREVEAISKNVVSFRKNLEYII